MAASHVAPIGDLARNPGMCPDWESNRQPFGLQPALNPLSYASQAYRITFKEFPAEDSCQPKGSVMFSAVYVTLVVSAGNISWKVY